MADLDTKLAVSQLRVPDVSLRDLILTASGSDGSKALYGDGTFKTPGGDGLAGWTASLETASPNDTVNASELEASGGTTDQDAVISPKGDGAFQLTLATGDSTGGNKRGVNAVDLQIWPTPVGKTSATAVASGTNSFTAGFGSTASGAFGVAIGRGATASGDDSFAFGSEAVASGPGDTTFGGTGLFKILGGFEFHGDVTAETEHASLGFDSPASGSFSATLGGLDSVADGDYSWVLGGAQSSAHGIHGYGAFGAGGAPGPTGAGKAQLGHLCCLIQTADATPTPMVSDGLSSAPSTTNQLILLDDASVGFHGYVLGRNGTTASSYWKFEGLIERGTGAASTALVGTVIPSLIAQDAGATTWAVAITADTTNGGLQITVTGAAATTISWIARIQTEELAF